MENLMFVFDRMPDQDGCTFVEVENESGESANAGEWRLRDDGLAELVVPVSSAAQSELTALKAELASEEQDHAELRDVVAALREENERLKAESFDGLYNEAIGERDALREELAKTKAQLEHWNYLDLQRNARLTAAEQRNAEDLRDAERYRALRTVTPYRFKKMQDASITDGGDVLYFHSDRFDALMDIEMSKPTESGASE